MTNTKAVGKHRTPRDVHGILLRVADVVITFFATFGFLTLVLMLVDGGRVL